MEMGKPWLAFQQFRAYSAIFHLLLTIYRGLSMKHQSKLSPRQSETVFDEAVVAPHHDDSPPTFKHRKPRRLRSRLRRRQKLSVLLLTGVFAVVSLALMLTIFSVHAEYSKWQMRVTQRQAELDALETQLKTGKQRLAALQSPQGRKQLLIDNGYLRAGDRYLEFPETPEEQRLAAAPLNDLSPRPDNWDSQTLSGGSIWRGAWNALGARWQAWKN